MFMAGLILVFSTALFFFYIQAFCERVLRREFDRAYFRDIINAIQLEFPRLREALMASAPMDYPQVKVALKCDFATLSYLLKNSDRKRQSLPREDKTLILYFRFLMFCLPFRYAMRLGSREAVIKLTTILQYFANSIGEKVGGPQTLGMATGQLT